MLKVQKVFHDGSDFKNQGFAAKNVGKVGGWKEHWKGLEAQNILSYWHLLQRILPFSKDLYNVVWNLDFCFFSLINKIMINIIHSFFEELHIPWYTRDTQVMENSQMPILPFHHMSPVNLNSIPQVWHVPLPTKSPCWPTR